MMDTTAITAITPTTMPSNDSNDRKRFARSEDKAIQTASTKHILNYYKGDLGTHPPNSTVQEFGVRPQIPTARGRIFPGGGGSFPPLFVLEQEAQLRRGAWVAAFAVFAAPAVRAVL